MTASDRKAYGHPTMGATPIDSARQRISFGQLFLSVFGFVPTLFGKRLYAFDFFVLFLTSHHQGQTFDHFLVLQYTT
jgi:hypothetical protein